MPRAALTSQNQIGVQSYYAVSEIAQPPDNTDFTDVTPQTTAEKRLQEPQFYE